MRIDAYLYSQLIEKFITKVWDVELTANQKLKYPRGHSSIWDVKESGLNGYNFFEALFVADFPRTERNHFTRKLLQYDGDTIPIKDEFLCVMLEYIGTELPENTPKRVGVDPRKKAEVLYKIFEQELFERADSLNIDESKKAIRSLITEFYEAISSQDFKKAFNCCNETMKYEIFDDDILRFAEVFEGLQYIRNVNIFNIDVQFDKAFCLAYYFETTLLYRSNLIDEIIEARFSEVDEFVLNVDALRKLGQQNDFWIEDFTISSLLTSKLLDYLNRYVGKEHAHKFVNIFGQREQVQIDRLVEIMLSKDDQGFWSIVSIDKVDTNHPRKQERRAKSAMFPFPQRG